MVKFRDICILGLIGVIQFFVLSKNFHLSYYLFIAYAIFCILYIVGILGRNADSFWTIKKKILYWLPIVVAIMINISYYVIDCSFSFSILILFLCVCNILIEILKYYFKKIGNLEVAAYAILWVGMFFATEATSWFNI